MIFKNSWALWFLLLLIPIIIWYIKKWKVASPSLGVSSVASLSSYKASFRVILMHLEFALKLAALATLIIALARPQVHDSMHSSSIEGTDIVLALDISSSMLATDLQPNRIDAAKEVASKFVTQRPNDNIGFVAFSGESLSLMPLTNDKAALVNAIHNAKTGALNDGTAIGDGLVSSINRLVAGQAKSKSIILLTDGTNNAGEVAPATAAQIAKQKGIRIYSIGVGTNGVINITDPYGFSTTTMETKIDEDALKDLALSTGGKYFRATDSRTLRAVFEEIDALEKSKINVDNFTHVDENYMLWAWIAFGCFLTAIVLRYTVLRRIP
ncbi:MAG: VWA domain-containing protein [Muribaculaceae bacterium]|nr:VWA domain-containing protein [Muribaculaceae bacterium]